jgi:hypothetical protein
MVPTVGDNVVLVPQAFAWLMNPHDPRNVIGRDISSVNEVLNDEDNTVCWESYRSDLLRKGFGLLVVGDDGKFREGPTWWDSGD